jgi:hypothetical protein
MRGFAVAGGRRRPDSPGGTSKVTDPAAAARLRELNGPRARRQQDIDRYTAAAGGEDFRAGDVPDAPGAISDDRWEARRSPS